MNTRKASSPGEIVRRCSRCARKACTAGLDLTASLISLLWVGPLVLVVVLSVRSFDDILANGLMALPRSFTSHGYADAWAVVVAGLACTTASSSPCQRCSLPSYSRP